MRIRLRWVKAYELFHVDRFCNGAGMVDENCLVQIMPVES